MLRPTRQLQDSHVWHEASLGTTPVELCRWGYSLQDTAQRMLPVWCTAAACALAGMRLGKPADTGKQSALSVRLSHPTAYPTAAVNQAKMLLP